MRTVLTVRYPLNGTSRTELCFISTYTRSVCAIISCGYSIIIVAKYIFTTYAAYPVNLLTIATTSILVVLGIYLVCNHHKPPTYQSKTSDLSALAR